MKVRSLIVAAGSIALFTGIVVAAGTWYAVCSDFHPPNPVSGWTGPDRTNQAQAQSDADAHRKQYPSHTVVVIEQ